MSTIENLQPVSKADTLIYKPYYTKYSKDEQDILPYALSLYQQGFLEGERYIESGENIPFVATWYVSKLPADLTRCRLQFAEDAELSYEVNMTNSEFIAYLIQLIKKSKNSRKPDFSQNFYRKLFRVDE
jgi:hypothetical protein